MRGRGLRRALALVGLAVLATGAVVLWPQPPSRITRENFDRLQAGMSRAGVEAILGPAGDYSTGPLDFDSKALVYFYGGTFPVVDLAPHYRRQLGDWYLKNVEWRNDRLIIRASFSSGDLVEKGRTEVARTEQTVFENLVWRAKRQWRRWFPEK